MDYRNMLNRILQEIQREESRHCIIIGDNSSGKSQLLKEFVEQNMYNVYYIDAANRYFNADKINMSVNEVSYSVTLKKIIDRRLEAEFFNFQDSFGNNDYIERLYSYYSDDLHIMMQDFLETKIEFKRQAMEEGFGEGSIETYINGERAELSSGYQAIFRMFSELLFLKNQMNGIGTIVIDEIDEFLSPNRARVILQYLMEQFPEYRFLVSTHSSDLICGTKDCKIIALEKKNFQIYDSNDYTTLTEVNMLFSKVFGKQKMVENNETIEMEENLKRLFKLKLSGCWSELEENELEEIGANKLTPVQKLLYTQIMNFGR